MNAVHLRRIDPARNMHRFYRLDLQPDLYGGGAHRRARAHRGRALRQRGPCHRRLAATR
jgi:predicted DNA-binding WGR domain protein